MLSGFTIDISRAVAAVLGLALAAPAVADDGGVRFCHAFDADSNTLFASQPIAAERMNGRSASGFAAFLKERGSAEAAQAACASAAGEPQAVRARDVLTRACSGCNAQTRLIVVNWPSPQRTDVVVGGAPGADGATGRDAGIPARAAGGRAAASRGDGIAAQPMGGNSQPGPTRVAATALPQPVRPTDAPQLGPLLIVMGNEDSGRIIAVRDRTDLADEALRRARAISPSGWTVLKVSREPGSGTAMCVKDGTRTRFFVAHPYPTLRDATKAAQEAARPLAARLGETYYLCGAAWTVMGLPKPEPETPPGTQVVGAIKGKMRQMLTCQEPPRIPGAKPTPKRCREADPRRTGACMCVRG